MKYRDHVDGIEELLNEIPSIKTVYGVDERIPFISKYLKDGDSFNVGSIEIFVIHHPCHTIGSASFHIKSDGHKQPDIVFTGDTLFLSGCGYFFEGTGSQMYDALYFRLGSLPGSTLVFPGHEYTINNLRVSFYLIRTQ